MVAVRVQFCTLNGLATPNRTGVPVKVMVTLLLDLPGSSALGESVGPLHLTREESLAAVATLPQGWQQAERAGRRGRGPDA